VDNPNTPSIVACLTAAALSLPGIMQPAEAGRVEETYNADFQYGHYSESSSRIDVNTYEGTLSAPIGSNMTGTVSLVRDIVSGASPKHNEVDSQGNIRQIVSGQPGIVSSASPSAGSSECGKSICDSRDDIRSSLTYFMDTAALTLNGGFSRENDYTSRYMGTSFSKEFNKKLTTANVGVSLAFDEIQPTEFVGGGTRNADCGEKCSKTSQQYLLGISQILNKDSLLLSNVTFSYNTGYLSDPYKRVYFFDGGQFVDARLDRRPREKFQFAWLTQYVRHFSDLNDAALHLDYRFSTDSWGLNAHTFEASWHQPLGDDWVVAPRVRYYSQDSADFYQAVGRDLNAGYYSSDYRLAGFGALSAGLHISKEIKGLTPLSSLKLQVAGEYYNHSASYQLGGSGDGDFADFNYYLITGSFNLRF
jgi:Protein of unknown function (DUF3570)